jgi:CSLREA domain-containing protein
MLRVALLVTLVIVALAWPTNSSVGADGLTFVVNSTADTNDGDCSLAVAGCTLREALNEANSAAGPDTVTFDPEWFPPDFVQVIQVLQPLPPLTQATTVDASEAGVHIYGGLAGPGNGLEVKASDVTILGVEISTFNGSGIFVCLAPDCSGDLASLTIDATRIRNNERDGIEIVAPNASNIIVANSTIISNNGAGFNACCNASLTNTFISGNNFASVPVPTFSAVADEGGNGRDAIDICCNATVTDLVIDGNDASSSGADALSLCCATVLTNAQITNNNFSASEDDGMDLCCITTVENLLIDANVVSGGGGGALDLCCVGTATDVVVSNNELSSSGAEGVDACCIGTAEGTVLGPGNLIDGNAAAGIVAGGTASLVATENSISNNGGDGIHTFGSGTITITRNEFLANGELGIDLGLFTDVPPGVSENDPGDVDGGANDGLNYPGDVAVVDQTVSGSACSGCLVEVFLSAGDPSGFGEGAFFLADAVASTGGFWSVPIDFPISSGDCITTTATDSIGNTSEFSPTLILGDVGLCEEPPEDSDGDGLLDDEDLCPFEAEDSDEFQDFDGCPEFDNDEDGFLDPEDACPESPLFVEVDENGCAQVEVDEDLDFVCDPDKASARWCTGSDECPDSDSDGVDAFGCSDVQYRVLLVNKHLPILYTFADDYQPEEVEIMLNTPERPNTRTRLMENRFLRPDRSIVQDPSPQDLAANPGGNNYIDIEGAAPTRAERGRYRNFYAELSARYSPTVYAQVRTSGTPAGLVIDYWVFYFFNDFQPLPGVDNFHEGDWERIRIIFPSGISTPSAAYRSMPGVVFASQHLDVIFANCRPISISGLETWANVSKVESRPEIFVARGSHAQFFTPGRHGCDLAPDRSHPVSNLTAKIIPTCGTVGDVPWLRFRGYWGEFRGLTALGSNGPRNQPRWNSAC